MSATYPVAQTSSISLLSLANACYVFSTSVAGISLMVSSIPTVVAGGVLAALVDIDVNRITLRSGFKKMFEQDYLLHRLARKKLLELAEQAPTTNSQASNTPEPASPSHQDFTQDFLNYYAAVYKRYQQLKGAPIRHATELRIKREELHALEKYAGERLLGRVTADKRDLIHFSAETCATFKSKYHFKQRLIRASWLINISAGLGTGLVTAFTAHLAIADLALLFTGASVALGPAAIIPLAVAAGTWYAITTYNNLHDIVVNESIRQKWQQIYAFLSNHDPDHPWLNLGKKIVVVLGLLLVLALGLFMTLATAGTWWYGVKHGARLLPLLSRIANYLVAAVVPCVALAAFLFNFNNFLETIWHIQKIFAEKTIVNKLEQVVQTWDLDNWAERLNPFRIIKGILESPIKMFLFIGHVISVGAITDRMPKMPPAVPMAVGATCEAGEDMHFLMAKDPGVITYLVAFVLLPLTVFDALWRYVAQTKTHPNPLSYKQCFFKSVGIEPEDTPPLAPAEIANCEQEGFNEKWQRQRLHIGVENLQQRYRFSPFQSTREKHQAIKDYLRGDPNSEYDDNVDRLNALNGILKKPRFGYFATKGDTFGATRLKELCPSLAA